MLIPRTLRRRRSKETRVAGWLGGADAAAIAAVVASAMALADETMHSNAKRARTKAVRAEYTIQ